MWKKILIIFLVFLSLSTIIISIDISMGMDIHEAIMNAINPFKVMEPPELLFLGLLIFGYICRHVLIFIVNYLQTRERERQSERQS